MKIPTYSALPACRASRFATVTGLLRIFQTRLLSCLGMPLLCVMLLPGPAIGATAELCDEAARQAARETGIPFAVLWSITRTETGRRQDGALKPWPWTVNIAGKGYWLKTRAAAQALARRQKASGAHSFDLGCFQINYKWHGASFNSVEQMLEPLENARYAAAFLLRLYHESGDWSVAAGAYHSRTQKYAQRYRARFDKIIRAHAEGAEIPWPQPVQLTASRPNSYPLLIGGTSAGYAGSLVPLGSGNTTALVSLVPRSGGS